VVREIENPECVKLLNNITEKNESINCYPNPTAGNVRFNFNIEKSGIVQLKIYDATGKIVSEPINSMHAQGSFNFDFNLSELSSGLYSYILTTPSGTIANKLNIQK
jgi:nitrogenase molybdenum-iron protein alpha/beta subunit